MCSFGVCVFRADFCLHASKVVVYIRVFLLEIHHVNCVSPAQKQLNDAKHQEREHIWMKNNRHKHLQPLMRRQWKWDEGSALKKAGVREKCELTG